MSRKASERALVVVGIDPGVSGAIAFLRYSRGAVFSSVHSMPTELKRSGRRQVAAPALAEIIASNIQVQEEDDELDKNGVKVLIEQVSAMPGQGVSGMFSLGDSFGVARAIASQYGEVSFVSPVRWKKALGLLKQDKAASLTLARRLYREARPHLFRKTDEGRAEAILIAHYARLCLKW